MVETIEELKTEIKNDLLPLAAAIKVALIRLAHDGDLGIFVILLVFLLLSLVTGRSGGGNGQNSGNNELYKRKTQNLSKIDYIHELSEKCNWVWIIVLPASC